MMDVFERTDLWRRRFNRELFNLFKEPRLSVIISIARLRWAGHVARMEAICMPMRLMYMQPEGLRKVGRPRARWRYEVGS
jgi:hypothetical protein